MGAESRVVIGPMKVEDITEVCALERQCFSTPWSYGSFLGELTSNDNAHYLAARCNKTLIGYVGVWIIIDEGHITNLAVSPLYRGKGVGGALLKTLTELVWSRGVTKMTLEVRVTNRLAQNLYRKQGFVDSGVRPRYYRDNQEDALIMWKDLTEDAHLNPRN